MENKIFIPRNPYVFKSGKHKDECTESFVFKNSDYLFYVRNRKHREGDALDKHLDFIFEAGCRLPTKIICPFCKKKMVKFFLLGLNLMTPGLTCCEDSSCQQELKSLRPGHGLIAFRLSSLGLFKKVTIRKKAELFFRKIYGLPRIIKPEVVFSLLKQALGEKEVSPVPPPRRKLRLKAKPDSSQLKLL